jgi:drug/metabolite transporter (DMT)-like permease
LGGVLLAIAGVVVLLGPGNAAELDAGETLARQMAVLAGAIAYAVNTVLARRRPAIDPLVYASGVTLVGALLAAPILLLSQVPLPLGASAPALVAVAWLGLFPTGLAITSLTSDAVPIVTLAASVLVFGESAGFEALAGLGLILIGIAAAGRSVSLAGIARRHAPPAQGLRSVA